jgi:phenylalanyl-tRNA synthetase beta chain
MKLSYKWILKYAELDYSPKEMEKKLTDCGLEVEVFEEYQSVKGGLEGIVIGKVLSKEKHPNADKLSLTKVDIGRGEALSIVCGAPNVEAGQTVVVAPVGSVLYPTNSEVFPIKKTKIRGEVSEGMICAEDELGIGTSHDGIMVLNDDIAVGTKAADYFKIENDYVFEIGLTPNRSDATSHIGAARDLVAVCNAERNEISCSLQLPDVSTIEIPENLQKCDIQVKDFEACPRYSGMLIENINNASETPAYIKHKLEAVGLRSINPIVDITNFVMLETGQALHAFDLEKLKGNKIIVQKLPQPTKFKTLDDTEREITPNDLMICNQEEPMCIAGVFGGANSGVTSNTKSIFLESAYFEAAGIRKTSKHHGLKTDASFRYERGADPNITIFALKRALQLLQDCCGAKAASQITDVFEQEFPKKRIELYYSYLDALIGKKIDRRLIKIILQSLEIEILEESNDALTVEVPTNKVDVTRPCDLVEEILRIYGYNNVEVSDKILSSLSFTDKKNSQRIKNIAADLISYNGYYEIMNNSLTKLTYNDKYEFDPKKNVEILNPLSNELNTLRRSLVFGALESMAHNINRQNLQLSFYEFGKVYLLDSIDKNANVTERFTEEEHLLLCKTGKKEEERWNTENQQSDFYDIKEITHKVLKRLGILDKIKEKTGQHPLMEDSIECLYDTSCIAFIGKIKKEIQKDFDIKQPVFLAEINWSAVEKILNHSDKIIESIPKYPEVRRDLALVLDESVSFAQIKQIAYENEAQILKSVNLFDIYKGDKIPENKKSYALSFVLQDKNKTLTDKRVEKTMDKIFKQIQAKTAAELR